MCDTLEAPLLARRSKRRENGLRASHSGVLSKAKEHVTRLTFTLMHDEKLSENVNSHRGSPLKVEAEGEGQLDSLVRC